MAIIVRMSFNGLFDARNGATYMSDTPVAYSSGGKYHARIVVNINDQIFDAWTTTDEGSPVQIANDYTFRSNAPTTDDIGKVCLKSDVNSMN